MKMIRATKTPEQPRTPTPERSSKVKIAAAIMRFTRTTDTVAAFELRRSPILRSCGCLLTLSESHDLIQHPLRHFPLGSFRNFHDFVVRDDRDRIAVRIKP